MTSTTEFANGAVVVYCRVDDPETIRRDGFRDTDREAGEPAVEVASPWPYWNQKEPFVLSLEIPSALYDEHAVWPRPKDARYPHAWIGAADLNEHLDSLRVLSDEEVRALRMTEIENTSEELAAYGIPWSDEDIERFLAGPSWLK